ncbi:MAG: hypothetical protein Q4E69_00540 [Bacilli bacterium]|nr:hypothetical protein [Bacilli bacterium]
MVDALNGNLSILEHIIINNKLPHAILIEVDDCNEGLKTVKEIVKLILCKNKDKSLDKINCTKCNICNLIDVDNYPDLRIISSDGNWIKKQQLIDLQNDFNNKSMLDNKRIYIINEAEKLNASSSNSLLKFLEEPEDDIVAILLTTNRYLLLDTIISRCQIFNLKNSDYNLDSDLFENTVNLLDYFIRKRNFFLDYKYLNEEVFTDKNITKKLLSEIEKCFLSYLVGVSEEEISKRVKLLDIEDIILYVKIIEIEKQKLEYNINFKMWLDSFYSRIIGEVYGRDSSSNR